MCGRNRLQKSNINLNSNSFASIILIPIYCIFLFSCHPNRSLPLPAIRFFLTIKNPSKDFSVTLGVRAHPDSRSAGQFFIQNLKESYREKNVLRMHLSDTLVWDERTFSQFLVLVRDAKLSERNGTLVGIPDGNVYELEIGDSNGTRSFTAVGRPQDARINTVIDFCKDAFEKCYLPVDFEMLDSRLDLRIYNRAVSGADSSQVRVLKNAGGITWENQNRGSQRKLPLSVYLALWRTLENNDVWRLRSDSSFAVKYPHEYRLQIQRGRDSAEWTVYAPSRLEDRRYYAIVNRIETIE